MRASRFILLFLLSAWLLVGCEGFFMHPMATCTMTLWHRPVDAINPDEFVTRHITGDEFLLAGVVRDAATCQPIANAAVIFDMTNTAGEYDGVQQGVTYSNDFGWFVIQSNRPGTYGGGLPHIHLYVGTAGYQPITVGYNLMTGVTEDWVNLTLYAL